MKRTYTRRELADGQFDRALSLFLDDRDYLSAITLAGAAEVLYGAIYKAAPPDNAERKHALDSYVEGMQRTAVHFGDEVDRTEAIASLNRVRDALKHIQDGKPIAFDAAEMAAEMIDRAIDNHRLLTGNYHPRVQEFDAVVREFQAKRDRELDALDVRRSPLP